VICTVRQTSVERYGMNSKVHSVAGHVDLHWEYRYISTLPLTLALDGVGGQNQAPIA